MRLLGTLFILLLATVVIGYVRGWFFVDTVEGAEHVQQRVVVDQDKVEADVGAVAEEVGALTKRAKELVLGTATRTAAGALEVDAQVVSVDSGARKVRLRIDEADVDFVVPTSTGIVVDGADARLDALLAGRDVRITVTAEGDQLLLQRIATR
ncbi:MAG: hypothetical protein H6835_04245 [Planctomycetes bacterium]|nr:hypothetical protein [Planctomycetota bacterium]